MREDFGLCTRVRHHQQKLVLFLSAMRHHAEKLRAEGAQVHYESLDPCDLRVFTEALSEYALRNGFEQIEVTEPSDPFLLKELRKLSIPLVILPNPAFLTTGSEWDRYAQTTRRRHMADFYQWQRRRLGILVERDGSPVGGQWSFDAENRKPLPKGHVPPPRLTFAPDQITHEVISLVESNFSHHPGRASDFAYGVTHSEGIAALDYFLELNLDLFGVYEDAVSKEHPFVHHSILTPYLNTGLLTPAEVVVRTLERHTERPVPLNSLEGFLRQVIGWREFIKGIDRDYERSPRDFDTLGHTRKLGPQWYSGTTGLPPVDAAIQRCLQFGWCHHIERLMVLGSVMLMSEIDPVDSYGWFMEMFMDSADWVMRPNIFGMSQFSDGGYFATKPYVSGSAYIKKMSDFPAGPWCEIWDGLYWRFIRTHRDRFASNHRMSMAINAEAKLPSDRRERINRLAEEWITSVTTP